MPVFSAERVCAAFDAMLSRFDAFQKDAYASMLLLLPLYMRYAGHDGAQLLRWRHD